jgi:polysaccharide pyruvyl transferase WcaK-like protein
LAAAVLSGVDLTVRDEPSADVLAGLGLHRPQVGADLALELPDPVLRTVDDVLAVALRPWSGNRSLLPVSLSRGSLASEPAYVARLVQLVDAVAERLDLAVRFVAFDTEKDDPLHRAVAERLRAEVSEVLSPDPFGALAAVACSRAVFAMRYHGGIAALVGRRPAVLLGYSPKVNSLAADVGAGFDSVPWHLADPAAVGAAAARAVRKAEDGVLDAALARLRARGVANASALDRLFGL